jgi:hypothetical protein
MRITLEPTTDGRWQIWLCDDPIDPRPEGMWMHTVAPAAVAKWVGRLVAKEQLAHRASLRRSAARSGG